MTALKNILNQAESTVRQVAEFNFHQKLQRESEEHLQTLTREITRKQEKLYEMQVRQNQEHTNRMIKTLESLKNNPQNDGNKKE